MKKRISLVKITSFVMLLTVTAMILVVGTYAKYSSQASGTDATVVAKWSFKVNGTEIAIKDSNPEVTFDLFNTIYDTATDKEETDVVDGLIAPGTSGSFEFALENLSDVTTKYAIKLEIDNTSIPLEFSIDGDTWTSIANLSDLVATDVMAIGSTKNVTVQWRWSFDGESDATLGGQTVKVTANITATQVDYIYSEKLEQKYTMSYYSDASQAVAVINDSAYEDDSLTISKDQASVALYVDENNMPNLLLLEDDTLDAALETSSDMIIDLGGKTLTFTSANGINITSGDVIINGTVEGSEISLTNEGQQTTLAQVNNGSLTLNEGIYMTTSNGVGTNTTPNNSIIVGETGELKVNQASIVSNDTNGGTIVGIHVEQGGAATLSNSDIEITSLDGFKSVGISNKGTITLNNTSVVAYSNYNANEAGTSFAAVSLGINSEGTTVLKNSEVYGSHSGIQSKGTLYIDGGKYEGYGHGGIYFIGANTTSYVKNAYIGESELKNGYSDGVATTNHAGFYIGGGANITVYMDNCELWGVYYPAVMRVNSVDDNNSLYISNSTLKEGFKKYIRIGTADKNIKIYIGTGNNFNADDHVYYSSNAETTDIDYSTLFPEY